MVKIVAFNKPYDVHSQFRGEENQITLSEFIHDPELRIAGRLDRDSEGLMLLTDHGQLNQFITNPKFKKFKTYIAQVEGEITPDAIALLETGLELADGLTLPAKAQAIDAPTWLWERDPPVRYRANVPTSWVEIQICEGRNRQVRRMTAAVGFPTLRLIRTRIGTVDVVDLELQPGQQEAIEPLFYKDFKDLPAPEPHQPRSVPRKKTPTNFHKGKPQSAEASGDKKKSSGSGSTRIWQLEEGERPRRKTNGTTRPNTKSRGRRER